MRANLQAYGLRNVCPNDSQAPNEITEKMNVNAAAIIQDAISTVHCIRVARSNVKELGAITVCSV
jgi:hypothetical protein